MSYFILLFYIDFLFFEHFANNSKTLAKSVTSGRFSKRYSQSYPQALWKTELLDNC